MFANVFRLGVSILLRLIGEGVIVNVVVKHFLSRLPVLSSLYLQLHSQSYIRHHRMYTAVSYFCFTTDNLRETVVSVHPVPLLMLIITNVANKLVMVYTNWEFVHHINWA